MKTLEQLRQECRDCRECPLGVNRGSKERVVFGEGPADARIIFIAERPGDREVERGRPMIGVVGEYFNTLLNRIGVDRKEVYIANAVMCAPPEGREPTAKELKACVKWLHQVIRSIDPVLVIAMGGSAVDSLAEMEGAVTHNYGRIVVAEIPGAVVPYKIPVGVIANPAFIRRENSYGKDSHGHWQLWAMQQLVRWADQLANAYFGDVIKQRGEYVFSRPSRIQMFPRVTPDECHLIDEEDETPDIAPAEEEEDGVPEAVSGEGEEEGAAD